MPSITLNSDFVTRDTIVALFVKYATYDMLALAYTHDNYY